MNRRDMLKASALVPAAGYVRPTTDRPARVVWLAICRTAGFDDEPWPPIEAFCRQQEAKGREILGTLRQAGDRSLVAVCVPGASRELCDRIEVDCTNDYDAAEEEYGHVFATAYVGAGESFDVAAFLALRTAVDLEREHQRRTSVALNQAIRSRHQDDAILRVLDRNRDGLRKILEKMGPDVTPKPMRVQI